MRQKTIGFGYTATGGAAKQGKATRKRKCTRDGASLVAKAAGMRVSDAARLLVAEQARRRMMSDAEKLAEFVTLNDQHNERLRKASEAEAKADAERIARVAAYLENQE